MKEENPIYAFNTPIAPPNGGLADSNAPRIPPGRPRRLNQVHGNSVDLFNRFAHSAGPGHEYVRSLPGGPGCGLAMPKPPKSRSRGTKIEVWRRLGASCRRLGASWGSRRMSWERLGRILGHLEGVLRMFWGVLGVSCMCLGGLLDPSCGHLGSVLGRLGGILCLTFMPNYG